MLFYCFTVLLFLCVNIYPFYLILLLMMQLQVLLRAADAVYEHCGVQSHICCVMNRCR